MRIDSFLNTVLVQLRKDRPKAPEALDYTILADRSASPVFRCSKSVSIGFRTRGCRYNHAGGCTMCDYWISDPVLSERMVESVEAALDELGFEPSKLLLNVSGSFLDDWEVPRRARRKILQLLSAFDNTHLIFETHANTVTEEKILECIEVLDHRRFSVEMGLESANPWILKHSVNKALDLEQLLMATKILRRHRIRSIVNVMIGLPFLTPSEMISDAVSSVNWAFSQGVDRCVLFPMNIKPWNLVFWLENQGLYECPPLWALVDVLSRLDKRLLPRIGLAWYRTRAQVHPEYEIPNRGPQTCSACYHRVMELLDRFVISSDRISIVRKLADLDCECRRDWDSHRTKKPEFPLEERVCLAYEAIGRQVLGEEWWSENGGSVLKAVVPPHSSDDTGYGTRLT